MSNTKTDKHSLPQTEAELTPSRDLSDTELNGVDGGLGVLSVAGSTKKKRPVEMRDLPPRKIPFFTEA
ncbi:hypothetical protein W911_02995 [Hyphomicrobium nitrativorans NL23]|uniref:Uncharacterized protein n=1 Tax=Hyphomicrobium nitrativorans NL23 TaxID=1029756 RepID=V5SIW5_9HYPH|nr:hypothetical protein [Hyphomicrobium nitrativorans]AHB49874.1 hypothetical protein W911_02995 [Hyphomicrobium nitrativorans NL23]